MKILYLAFSVYRFKLPEGVVPGREEEIGEFSSSFQSGAIFDAEVLPQRHEGVFPVSESEDI